MRVTMLVRCLAMMRGGGETRHLAWARELAAVGVDVQLVTGQPLLFGRARYHTDGFRVTTLRSPYARDFVYRFQKRRGFGRLTMHALHLDEEWFCRAAWRHIRSSGSRPDVVHAHALYQAARLRAADTPVVIHVPGEQHARYTADLQLPDAVVADGWAADRLPAVLGRRVDRVPKGVDAELFRPDGPDRRDALRLRGKRVILAVARLVPIKNVALLVHAFAIVRARVPDVHLLVVGGGPEAMPLREHAMRLDVADAVTFAGEVAQSQTPLFYRSADVFALSSDFDNSPNVVLEAMASGLPVVTTDVGGVREFVADGLGGTVVPPNAPDALAAALEKYLARDDLTRAASSYNRTRASTDFSWRASTLRLLDVYHRVVASRAAA